MNSGERPDSCSIHSLSLDQLVLFCQQQNIPKYRAKQIWRWLYVQHASAWDDMQNLPASLRQQLADNFHIALPLIVHCAGSPTRTQKLLLQLPDAERIEVVIIPARKHATICVSSQVGCQFHCPFCASGQDGLKRNLTIGEIVQQVLVSLQTETNTNSTNVVFMGMGEPFDNYDHVLSSIRIINDHDGLNIGARRITISTCGIIPGIQRLAGEGLQVELSVSLHAPDNNLRSQIVPANKKYPIEQLLSACNDYTNHTGRIVTFEYTMIDGTNVSPEQARQLAAILKPLHCRVNLIPLSAVSEFAGQPAPAQTAEMFVETLDASGINATIRASKGSEVKAACGQLRQSCPATHSAT